MEGTDIICVFRDLLYEIERIYMNCVLCGLLLIHNVMSWGVMDREDMPTLEGLFLREGSFSYCQHFDDR